MAIHAACFGAVAEQRYWRWKRVSRSSLQEYGFPVTFKAGHFLFWRH